jgi:hypothetical protein
MARAGKHTRRGKAGGARVIVRGGLVRGQNKAAMTSYTTFGEAAGQALIPYDELPANVQTALVNSFNRVQTAADDGAIGSAMAGVGFCYENPQQLYCACVNAPIAAAECIFAPCSEYANLDPRSNAGAAYVKTNQQQVLNDASKLCPTSVNCEQVFIMGGSGNIANNVSQTQNCGGVVNVFVTNVKAHPFLAVVVLVLVLSVAMLLADGRGKKGELALPPPGQEFPRELTE